MLRGPSHLCSPRQTRHGSLSMIPIFPFSVQRETTIPSALNTVRVLCLSFTPRIRPSGSTSRTKTGISRGVFRIEWSNRLYR